MTVDIDSDSGEVVGWNVIGDGRKPHFFDETIENAGYAKFQRFTKALKNG